MGGANAKELVFVGGEELGGMDLNFIVGVYDQTGDWAPNRGAHDHTFDECLLFFGYDDEDMSYLGSDMSLAIGKEQEKHYFSPGDSGFKVWKTRYGNVGVGICWDQWFPETARCLALRGAEVLLFLTAIGSEPEDDEIDSRDHWQRVMQGHAGANLMPLVASNRVSVESGNDFSMTFYGSSLIADHKGAKLAEANRSDEAVLTATVDLMPTVMALHGLEPTPTVQGRSILPLVNGSEADHHDAVLYGYFGKDINITDGLDVTFQGGVINANGM